MSDKTTIEWTQATFNPWWGCTRVSPGCDNCYAARDAARFFPGQVIWDTKLRRVFDHKHWAMPLGWNRRAEQAGKRMRVFCASMADVFDNNPGLDEERDKLWTLIHKTPHLDWQILTKRVGNIARMVPPSWLKWHWPSYVWLGISVVNQEEADRDIPKLLELPVRIRWLSCEPLLGRIDLNAWLLSEHGRRHIGAAPGLSWVVAGGESGPKARPMHPDWPSRIRDQCIAAGVPFLFKQWGEHAPNDRTFAEIKESGRPLVAVPIAGPDTRMELMDRVGKKAAGRTLDGRTWDEYPT